MRTYRWAISFVMIALLMGGMFGIVSVDSSTPVASAPFVFSPVSIGNPLVSKAQANYSADAGLLSSTGVALAPLKAVIVVGPVAGSGDNSGATLAIKTAMDQAANALASHGVTVVKYYTPNNDWNQIKADAQNAQFFLYGGDGVLWPNNVYGGFSLKGGMISPDQIRNEMKLAPNAIVMINACYSAGASGSDPSPISSAEAQYRVAQYSDAFFDIGAGGYFADWYQDAFANITNSLFQGKTLGQAYKAYGDFAPSTLETYTHPYHNNLSMWLDKGAYNHEELYSYAFAGKADSTLGDLFPAPVIALSASSTTFLADLTTGTESSSITISNSDWSASVSSGSSWLSISPTSGSNGQSLTLTANTAGKPVGTYTSTVTISPLSPGVQPIPQSLTVTLKVVNNLAKVYIPAVAKTP